MVLSDIISMHKGGESIGITSVCSAHPFVLETAIARAVQNDQILLVESTCNQVNQFGGYTGNTPSDFVKYLKKIASANNLPPERLVIGGDHLGPNPWTSETAQSAMNKALNLVRNCVSAGYRKIHLDASSPCIDDDPRSPALKPLSAQRSAELCSAAEKAAQDYGDDHPKPVYIIGTEVPSAGGAISPEEEITVTSVEDVEETIALTKQAFVQKGLEDAWERVIAVVVQPGVEFSGRSISSYNRERARHLVSYIGSHDKLVYEAHSTDYQTRDTLRQLVEDHFAILKVGPALTFAYREAIISLEMMNNELATVNKEINKTNIRKTLDDVMISHPDYWQAYYPGSGSRQRFDRMYSLSDRARYYWADPSLVKATDQLFESLSTTQIPLSILSQFMPEQYRKIRHGILTNDAWSLVSDKIATVLTDYSYACGL